MSALDLTQHPHRRFNPLTGEFILVSPQRAQRPWQGKVEQLPLAACPAYDSSCYLCPGNLRAGGLRTPPYSETFVFENDFSALREETPADSRSDGPLLLARGEPGRCRVVCFSPRHDLTLAEMDPGMIAKVVRVWQEEFATLGAKDFIRYVQIFENKGEVMGCSNPHPHGQIWAQDSIPVEPAKELERQQSYVTSHGSCLLCSYLEIEMRRSERVVCANESFVALVPFWAVWPFELMILSRRHFGTILEFSEGETEAFADILKKATVRYDNLFQTSFPYSAGLHQSPTDGGAHPEWHLHMHFFPPLLRSASVKKFMVGYEMLANPQRDITPELSAARLREQTEQHYRSA